MAFCTHCGAPLPDDAQVCTRCGQAQPASPRQDVVDLESSFVEDPQPGVPALSLNPPPPTPPAYTPPPAPVPMQAAPYPQVQNAPVPKRKKKKGGALVVILLLLVLLAAAAIVFRPRILEALPSLQRTDKPDPRPESVVTDADDIFESVDDLTPEERITYLKALLERTEATLDEELAKGTAADPDVLEELQTGIVNINKELRRLERYD